MKIIRTELFVLNKTKFKVHLDLILFIEKMKWCGYFKPSNYISIVVPSNKITIILYFQLRTRFSKLLFISTIFSMCSR